MSKAKGVNTVRTVRLNELVPVTITEDSEDTLCLGGDFNYEFMPKPDCDEEFFFYLKNRKPYSLTSDFENVIQDDFIYHIQILSGLESDLEIITQRSINNSNAWERLTEYVAGSYIEYIKSGFDPDYLQNDSHVYNLFRFLQKNTGIELGEVLMREITKVVGRLKGTIISDQDDIPF